MTRATIDDVAELAGVSIKTVSRVVNGSPKVSPEVIESVRAAISRLGYTPNRAARSLANRRSMVIALVVPEDTTRLFGDPYFAAIVKGITDQAVLTAALRECASGNGFAVVESDLRAHLSPSRMRNIRECAVALATRIATPCPQCAGPGWGRIEPARGLPCSACGTYVESAIRADRFGCPGCPATAEAPRADQAVEPRWCPSCNP